MQQNRSSRKNYTNPAKEKYVGNVVKYDILLLAAEANVQQNEAYVGDEIVSFDTASEEDE